MKRTSALEILLKKVEQLDPDDPVRRGLLEVAADFMLSRNSRKIHQWKRLARRIRKIDYPNTKP